ncbi:hypothetical protein NIES2100_04200 [Calothrix sp. NIES-2100]|uniref:type V CRISPR-associated protein Cas12k n=1 Tax=Calothrix sp. NIES-2100 TaxID=1954172 RepID=UPI000B61B17B|nr:hypothetical protein NIES2100_04200 [Calothrix sp. NIES-2100]
MSVITIQCRLIAHVATLRYLWKLMAEKNTPLINELLEQVAEHPNFEAWLKKGEVSKTAIKTICNSLKTQERFNNQPGRFYTSAVTLVHEVYKSWFALQQRRQRQINGKERWLNMLKSDIELQQESQCDLNVIRAKATEILNKFNAKFSQKKKYKSKKKANNTKNKNKEFLNNTLFSALFDMYDKTEDCLSKCALAYLLKNNCEVNELDEDQEKYAKNKRQKEIEIERLKKQIISRKPKGRDITAEKWLSTLEKATNQVSQNEDEAKSWQASLLRRDSCMPYPIDYDSDDLEWRVNSLAEKNNILEQSKYDVDNEAYKDVNWSDIKNKEGYILVKFNGLKEIIKHPEFYVGCDSRQLDYFQRFCQDWKIWNENQETYSSGLFLLRSARLLWQERKGKGDPWTVHRLILQCSIETRLWTQEETELVRLEKIDQADKTISNMEKKDSLNKNQVAYLKKTLTTRRKLNNPFPGRPSQALYQGKSSILVGVSLGLDKPATVAVVDAASKKVLTYRSVKQLLGQKYNLLNRQRQQQQRLSHERHKAQKQNAPNSASESELGQYIDRLLADAIVAIAKTYSASSIVLPKLQDLHEIIESEIQVKAEKKVPGYKEGQKNYAKQYRVNIHRWSYGRLFKIIQSQAAKASISIEITSSVIRSSPQEKARDLALLAYQERQAKLT